MAHSPKWLASLALVAVVGLTACGGGSDSSKSPAASSKVVETTPAGTQKVDSVVWGLPTGEPTAIDPMIAGGASESTVSVNLCESLLTVQPDFTVEPGLATSAEWTTPTTFVLDLREDVTFWDGTPMTADDVVYSLKRTADPKGPSFYSGAFRGVKSIEKSSPSQVTITVSAHDAQFRNTLAGPAGAIVQAAFAQKAGRSFGTSGGGVMCTGPYEFVSWKSGDSIEIAANPDYWNGEPKVGAIEFRFVGDTATLTTALRSGEIDGAYDLPISAAVALNKAGSGTLYRGAGTQSLSFGPASDQGPAADPRVREALSLAIDRKALISSVLRGMGTVQRTFTAPLAWQGDPAAAIYQEGYDGLPGGEPDLKKAKALVEEAVGGSSKLVMAIPAGGGTESQAAVVVQAAAKEIGLQIELRTLQPTEFSELFYNPAKRAEIDFVCTTGYQEVPGSLYYAPEFTQPAGLFNWSRYSDPEVSKLIDDARASSDPEVIATKFTDAQAIFAPDNLQVTLAGMDSLLYLRDGLSGAPASIAHLSSPWALTLGGTK